MRRNMKFLPMLAMICTIAGDCAATAGNEIDTVTPFYDASASFELFTPKQGIWKVSDKGYFVREHLSIAPSNAKYFIQGMSDFFRAGSSQKSSRVPFFFQGKFDGVPCEPFSGLRCQAIFFIVGKNLLVSVTTASTRYEEKTIEAPEGWVWYGHRSGPVLGYYSRARKIIEVGSFDQRGLIRWKVPMKYYKLKRGVTCASSRLPSYLCSDSEVRAEKIAVLDITSN